MPTPRPRSMQWGAMRQLNAAVRAASAPGAPSVPTRLAAVPRMVRAAVSGEYDGCTPLHLAALVGAAAYIVSPVDLLPEAVLSVVGLADDAVVLAWFASALVRDTDDFLAWEKSRERTVRSERVR
ncbi:YkvA family protein [Luteipulveratus halotolerans]|nr:YkvA family protein [Luteipulveratus halotolerans]